MNLLDLPIVMVEHVLSFLTFDEVAKTRLVCKDFDTLCQRLLNRGFLMIERRHALSLKAIKALLPRRESERRFHTLARHCDILTSIETRLSMLSMTYGKFMDNSICCFIPGKVIDEIRRVLTIVEESETLPRAHEVLQELRDISSMAIEHFDDKVSPPLRLKMVNHYNTMKQPNNSGEAAIPVPQSSVNPLVTTSVDLMCEVRSRCLKGRKALLVLSKKYQKLYTKVRLYRRQMRSQKLIILDISKKQAEQESCIAELKKRIEECDVKYQELTHSQGGIKGLSTSSHPTVIQQRPDSGQVRGSGGVYLKHYSSQICLDPPPHVKGVKRTGNESPNIKPRKTTLEPPASDIAPSGPIGRFKRMRMTFTIGQHPPVASINDVSAPLPADQRPTMFVGPSCSVPDTSKAAGPSPAIAAPNADVAVNERELQQPAVAAINVDRPNAEHNMDDSNDSSDLSSNEPDSMDD